jgi:hypothetical protein
MFSRTFLSGVVQLNRILVGSVSFSRCSKEQVAFRECSAGLFHSRCNPKDLAFQMCTAKVQQGEFLQGGLPTGNDKENQTFFFRLYSGICSEDL